MFIADRESNATSILNLVDSAEDLLYALFQHSPVGTIIFDEQLKLIEANQVVFSLFNQPELVLAGKLFGNTFNCKVAVESNGICGETSECRNCKLRNSLTDVIQTGIGFENAELEHVFTINGRTDKMWFSVNATPVKHREDNYAVVSLLNITKIKKREEKLVILGITDELTGLFNRRFILEQLVNQLKRINQAHGKLSVVLLDIDNFKRINDTYGHLIGDEVLREFSEIIKSSIRYSDFAGRYGGEEFLVILPECDHQNGRKLFERISSKLNDHQIQGIHEPITFSAGLVEVTGGPAFNTDSYSVLAKADKLLYKAKANGKNRIES